LTELKDAEKFLEQLDTDYTHFKASIRANAELVYTPKRLTTDQKCQEIANLVDQIQQEHHKASLLIQKNSIYYQQLSVHLLEYKDNLAELDQLEEEKIRLDILSE